MFWRIWYARFFSSLLFASLLFSCLSFSSLISTTPPHCHSTCRDVSHRHTTTSSHRHTTTAISFLILLKGTVIGSMAEMERVISQSHQTLLVPHSTYSPIFLTRTISCRRKALALQHWQNKSASKATKQWHRYATFSLWLFISYLFLFLFSQGMACWFQTRPQVLRKGVE